MAKANTKSAAKAAGAKKKFRILSIDGGGIRGIIPGQILVNLEQILQKKRGDANARIADYFDLIAGTSTGGILACVYLVPEVAGSDRPRFSAKEAVELYLERGDEVFSIPMWHKIRTGGGLSDEKYPADGLEGVLKEYFGDFKLSELLKGCLITSYDVKRRQAHMFSRDDAQPNAKGPGWDYYVRDVARATAAAPTYFELPRIKSMTNIPYPLVDGGLYANNPAMCAFSEANNVAKGMGKGILPEEIVLVSLGTGQVKEPFEYEVAKDWGKVGWVGPIIEIMMSAVAETVDYQLKQLFRAAGVEKQYLRISPGLEDAKPDMDDASMGNLTALREAGQSAAQFNQARLDEIADLLIEHG